MTAVTSFCLDSTSLKSPITHCITFVTLSSSVTSRFTGRVGGPPVVGASLLSKAGVGRPERTVATKYIRWIPRLILVGYFKPQTVGSVPVNLPARRVTRCIGKLQNSKVSIQGVAPLFREVEPMQNEGNMIVSKKRLNFKKKVI